MILWIVLAPFSGVLSYSGIGARPGSPFSDSVSFGKLVLRWLLCVLCFFFCNLIDLLLLTVNQVHCDARRGGSDQIENVPAGIEPASAKGT